MRPRPGSVAYDLLFTLARNGPADSVAELRARLKHRADRRAVESSLRRLIKGGCVVAEGGEGSGNHRYNIRATEVVEVCDHCGGLNDVRY